jgi:AhpD family alkylhydroperoxidase
MSHSETLARLTIGEIIMAPRIDVTKYPDALKAMYGLERIVRERGIERKLLHLIKTRVSQINGCAYCIDMHTADARKDGETERRLYAVTAWRETPFFTGRERAALAWTEALTRLSETHAPDADYELLNEHFTPKEMVDLTVAINAINGWNRLAVGFRKMPEA